jgi:hypothetical protein
MSRTPPAQQLATRSFSIAFILIGGLGGLLTVSLIAALGLALYIAQDNTVQLLQLRAQSLVQMVESAATARLAAAALETPDF